MKKLDLNYFGVQEMNAMEMKETDGGIIWLLIAAAVVLLTSSCINNVNFQVGGSHNTINSTQKADSSLNGNSADSTLNGNNLCVKPLDY